MTLFFLCGLKGRSLGYILKTKCIPHEFLSAHCELTAHRKAVSTPERANPEKGVTCTVFSSHWKEEGLTVDTNKWTDNFNLVYINNLRAQITSVHHVNTTPNVVSRWGI